MKKIVAEIAQARKEIPVFSQIARYMLVQDMKKIDYAYKTDSANIKAEYEFGLEKLSYIKKLVDDEKFLASELLALNEDESENKRLKDEKHFLNQWKQELSDEEKSKDKIKNDKHLPLGALVRLLARQCRIIAKNKGYDNDYGKFRGAITYGCKWGITSTLSIGARYDHMMPFISATLQFEKEQKKYEIEYSAEYEQEKDCYYEISYKNHPLTVVYFNYVQEKQSQYEGILDDHPQWYHGIGGHAKDIWSDMQETHQSLLEMSEKDIEEKPNYFYSGLTTILGLSGNLTFVYRGTGRDHLANVSVLLLFYL